MPFSYRSDSKTVLRIDPSRRRNEDKITHGGGESIDDVTCGNQMSRFTAFVTKVRESIRRRRASSCICVFGEASAQGVRPAKINWTAVGRSHLFLYGYTRCPGSAESFITISCPITGISVLMTTHFNRNSMRFVRKFGKPADALVMFMCNPA